MDPVLQRETPKAEKSGITHNATHTTQSHLPMASIDNADERLLARIGYKQELRREFTRGSTISYAISLLGVLGSQPATYGVPVSVGGPATAVWAWFIGWIMAMIIASSVSELVSAYPTAGGMYFVTKAVVPKKHVAIWGWIIGWCNLLGQACGVASIAYTIAQMMWAVVIMQFGSTYSPHPWQIVGVAILFLVVFGLFCSLTTSALHRTVLWFAPIHVIATIAIGVALLTLTKDKRDPSFVFTDFRDGSGWNSKALSFFLGFLNVAWVMTDYDGTTHMSEETHDAAIRGPVAIMLSVGISGALGLFLNIVFTFCLSENYIDDMVNSPTGLPVAQIFLNAGGKSGGIAMFAFVILVQIFTGMTAMLANTRMAYAFARDNALPFSGIWSQVNGTTGTPIAAVWLVVGFCICLNLIGLGSTETIVAVFNLCAPCLDLSYIAVLVARWVYTKKDDDSDDMSDHESRGMAFIPGPWTLGKWSKTFNFVAIGWVLFISTILFLPTTRPVTATNMNYAIVVAAGVGVVSLGWWWAGARNKYHGPQDNVGMQIVSSDEGEYDAEQPPSYPLSYGTADQNKVSFASGA